MQWRRGGGGTGSEGLPTVDVELAHSVELADTIDCFNPPAAITDSLALVTLSACRAAKAPTAAQLEMIEVALAEVGAVAGCEYIAEAGSQFLQAGTLKVFPESAGTLGSQKLGGSASSIPGHGTEVMLSSQWFGKNIRVQDLDGSTYVLALRWALVHELSHKESKVHINGSRLKMGATRTSTHSDTFRCAGK